MLMDLFFDTIPMDRKRRWHHHELMFDSYARIHRSGDKQSDIGNECVLLRIARELIQEAIVMGADELQLPDPYSLETLTNIL